MPMVLRPLTFALLALAFLGHSAHGQEDDYGGEGMGESMEGGDDDYGGDMGGGGGGFGGDEGMGGEPPPEGGGGGSELLTVDDFEAFLDNADASVIGAFTAKEILDPTATLPEGWDDEEDGPWSAPTIENPALASFNTMSSTLYGYRFAYTTAPEVLAKLKSKSNSLYLYRSPKFASAAHGDRPRERFPSSVLSENAVSNWLRSKAQPLVGLYSATTKERYAAGPVLVIFMNLDFDINAKSVAYVLKRARKAAAGFAGKLRIAIGNIADSTYDMNKFGLSSVKPTIDILMGVAGDADDYYPAASGTSFSAASLQQLGADFLAGKIEAYVAPEPEPAGGEGGGDEMGGEDDYSGDEGGEGEENEEGGEGDGFKDEA